MPLSPLLLQRAQCQATLAGPVFLGLQGTACRQAIGMLAKLFSQRRLQYLQLVALAFAGREQMGMLLAHLRQFGIDPLTSGHLLASGTLVMVELCRLLAGRLDQGLGMLSLTLGLGQACLGLFVGLYGCSARRLGVGQGIARVSELRLEFPALPVEFTLAQKVMTLRGEPLQVSFLLVQGRQRCLGLRDPGARRPGRRAAFSNGVTSGLYTMS